MKVQLQKNSEQWWMRQKDALPPLSRKTKLSVSIGVYRVQNNLQALW
jgi:hypothetical protein